jgi:SHS family lactate transporter-like MFS transporter
MRLSDRLAGVLLPVPGHGWRDMFILGAIPALLVLYIRGHIEESPSFLKNKHRVRQPFFSVLRANLPLFS